MSVSFGRSSSKTKPLYKGTQYSSVRDGGRVFLDPSIRSLEDIGINTATSGQAGLSRATGSFGSNMGELRAKLFSNMDPYMTARVDPFLQAQARDTGIATQNLSRRGLTGSSFADQTLRSINQDYGRQIADQRALATNESINQASNIDQLILQANQAEANGDIALAEYLRSIAMRRSQTEGALLTATGSSSSGFNAGISTSSSGNSSGGGVA